MKGGGAIFRMGLLLESSEEGARRIKRLMRRAERRSTVNCVEFWEQRKVLDRKSSSVEKRKIRSQVGALKSLRTPAASG